MPTYRMEASLWITFYKDFDTMAEAQDWADRCERSDDTYIPEKFQIETLHMGDVELASEDMQTQEED